MTRLYYLLFNYFLLSDKMTKREGSSREPQGLRFSKESRAFTLMIKAIAFDLDNTLIDFMKFKREASRAAAKAMVGAGLKKDAKTVENDIHEIYKNRGIEYQKTFAALLWDTYKMREDWGLFEKIQQAGIVAYRKKMFETLKPYPAVVSALKKLRKKYKLAIVTDAPRNKAWRRLYMSRLADFFDVVVTLDDTRLKKPRREPFVVLLKKLKLKPQDILFVGDHPKRDILGARKAGMKTAWAKYGRAGKTKKTKANFVLEKPSDLNLLGRRY